MLDAFTSTIISKRMRRQNSLLKRQGFLRRQESRESKTSSAAPLVKKRPMKSCLKVATLNESLHSTYYAMNAADGAGGSERRGITWDTIEIREYARTVGDNPSCSSGPPIAIDWMYTEPLVLSIGEFEEYRPKRRTTFELMLGRTERQEMLLGEWGIPKHDVVNAIRNNTKVKNQRRRTLNNIGRASNMEEALESIGKKLKETVLRREKNKAEKLYKASLTQTYVYGVESPQDTLNEKEEKRQALREKGLLRKSVSDGDIRDYDTMDESGFSDDGPLSDMVKNAKLVEKVESLGGTRRVWDEFSKGAETTEG